MDLREWTIIYVKHKDLFAKRLQSVEEKEGKVIFHFKDHQLHAYALETLTLPEASSGKSLITTLQTRENVSFLIKNFKSFAKREQLTIVFVNPKTDEKWLINPHTHDAISEGKAEPGIRTLADGVRYVE